LPRVPILQDADVRLRALSAGEPNQITPRMKVFPTTDAAETWLEENDPEGVAFEYEVLE
jgi:hypothetical protein